MSYVGKPIGARRLTWFPIVSENEETGAIFYGSPIKLSRLINIVLTPVLATGVLESDDGIEDNMSQLVAYDVTINASQLTDTIRAALLGHAKDEDGGVAFSGTDVAPYGALAFEKQLSSKTTGAPLYEHEVLYKGNFQEISETANTVVESGITYQTHNLTGRFLRRNDGLLRYKLRDDTPGASAAKIAAWFAEPQYFGSSFDSTASVPAATPASGAVAANTNVSLVTTTSGADIHYTLDGSEPNSTSTVYDGPITVKSAMTIKAKAFKQGVNPSPLFTGSYTITG